MKDLTESIRTVLDEGLSTNGLKPMQGSELMKVRDSLYSLSAEKNPAIVGKVIGLVMDYLDELDKEFPDNTGINYVKSALIKAEQISKKINFNE